MYTVKFKNCTQTACDRILAAADTHFGDKEVDATQKAVKGSKTRFNLTFHNLTAYKGLVNAADKALGRIEVEVDVKTVSASNATTKTAPTTKRGKTTRTAKAKNATPDWIIQHGIRKGLNRELAAALRGKGLDVREVWDAAKTAATAAHEAGKTNAAAVAAGVKAAQKA